MNKDEKRQIIYKCIMAICFVACITAILTFYMTYERFGSDSLFRVDLKGDSSENIKSISNVLGNFRELIDEYYIGDIDEQKLADETIKGYINGLDDEYSEYMTKEEWEDYQADALGNYVGIGIYMSLDVSDNIVILEPIEGSPAEEARNRDW